MHVFSARRVRTLRFKLSDLHGRGRELLQRLYKVDRNGYIVIPLMSNYELVLSLLHDSPDAMRKWMSLNQRVCRNAYDSLLQQLLKVLKHRHGVAISFGYSCWAEMKLKRHTSEGKNWNEIPRLLKRVGRLAASAADYSLQRKLHLFHFIANERVAESSERLSIDSWIQNSMRTYRRGVSDVESSAYFSDKDVLQNIWNVLEDAYDMRAVPVVKNVWKGLGRSITGLPNFGQVYAIFDREIPGEMSNKTLTQCRNTERNASDTSKSFYMRQSGDSAHLLCTGVENSSDLFSWIWPYKNLYLSNSDVYGEKRTSGFTRLRGFIYFFPFDDLRVLDHIYIRNRHSFACHVEIGMSHHIVQGYLTPAKMFKGRLLDLNEVKILFHELGHALKELFQYPKGDFTYPRPFDFDESFAILNEYLMRFPQTLKSLARDHQSGKLPDDKTINSWGLDLTELFLPNSSLATASVDFAIHGPDFDKKVKDGRQLEQLIKQSMEEVLPYSIPEEFSVFTLEYLRNLESEYAGATSCYVLAELRAAKIMHRLGYLGDQGHTRRQNNMKKGVLGTNKKIDMRPVKRLMALKPTLAMESVVNDNEAFEAFAIAYNKQLS